MKQNPYCVTKHVKVNCVFHLTILIRERNQPTLQSGANAKKVLARPI
jgi:hypothetical protein